MRWRRYRYLKNDFYLKNEVTTIKGILRKLLRHFYSKKDVVTIKG